MRRLIGVASVLLIAACAATPTLVEAGPYGEGGYAVTLERPWTEIPKNLSAATDHSYLTYDGPRLNQVHLLSVPAGEGIVETRDDDQVVPTFRAGMTSLELVELVTESVAQFGYQNVATADVRPATLAGTEGVGFIFTAVQENGLRIKGAAVAAESGEALDVMLFIAPELHYYEAYRPEVERLLASATRR